MGLVCHELLDVLHVDLEEAPLQGFEKVEVKKLVICRKERLELRLVSGIDHDLRHVERGTLSIL